MDDSIRVQAETAFIRARIQLLSTKPFYAHLVMKLQLRWMDDCPGGLSATDGTHMMINPEAYLALSKQEQVSVLVHEVLHCAAGHLFRRGSRDPLRWNIAGDVYIANVLAAEQFAPVQIAEDFFSKRMKIRCENWKDKTTDEIYEGIKLPGQSGGKGSQNGSNARQSGNSASHWQGEGGCCREADNAGDRTQGDAKWRQAVIEAGQLAGNAPGAWHELVKAAMPRPPFHLKLFEYLNRGIGGDTTFDAFNRRYLWQGMYLPTETRLVMGEIAVAVDTSGSMSTEQLQLALGYIRAFREQHPCKLHLIQCDYDAVGDGQYHLYDDYEQLPSQFEVVGRGGTSFNPPFTLMREKRVDPKVLIYLTDGYGQCSVKNPGYPVLWVVIRGDESFKPPFGEVVYVRHS